MLTIRTTRRRRATIRGPAPSRLRPPEPADESAALRDQLIGEIRQLAPWHAEQVKRRGRTTVGISGASVEQVEELARAAR